MVWSYILDFENSRNPFLFKQQAIAEWRKLAVVDVEETDEIIQQADIFYSKGLRTQDALHLACAFAGKCDYFLPQTEGILRKTQELTNFKVINLSIFLTLDK